jgi:hypothetical protein
MRGARYWAALACACVAFVVATGIRPEGDGGEYLLEAHALAYHASLAIEIPDVQWLGRSEPRWRRFADRLERGMRQQRVNPRAAISRAREGRYHSIHFWFYSLAAVPFLWLCEGLKVPAIQALALANAASATAALYFLARWAESARRALLAGLFFLLSGTTFYLGWCGPEVLTAGAALIACLAARRGALGIGALAGAVASTQNPSALVLLAFVAWRGFRLQRRPSPRDLALAAVAVVLAALPYAFFLHEYGEWSVIARYATDLGHIGSERAWSLLFDLDEGMIMGVPGLMLGFAAACLMLSRVAGVNRRLALEDALITLLLVAAMAVPTLTIDNWNSGNVVFIRYGYWLSMPLFAFCFDYAQALSLPVRAFVFTSALGLQLLVLASNGIRGERYSYLRHSPLARYVLAHAPGAYNPVPEIFCERSLGREVPCPEAVAWPPHKSATKLLVRGGHTCRSPEVCPDGGEVAWGRTHAVSAGFVYLDGPFACLGEHGADRR